VARRGQRGFAKHREKREAQDQGWFKQVHFDCTGSRQAAKFAKGKILCGFAALREIFGI
jgi:hypothetical protein